MGRGRRRARSWFRSGPLYGAVEVATPHCRRRRSCQREGEERHGVAVASVHGGDEDDFVLFFSVEGVRGMVLGCAGLVMVGCFWTSLAGLLRQVSPGKSISSSFYFPFSVLIFYFEFCFNSILFCSILNVWILFGSL
jgi:hypothetical protein